VHVGVVHGLLAEVAKVIRLPHQHIQHSPRYACLENTLNFLLHAGSSRAFLFFLPPPPFPLLPSRQLIWFHPFVATPPHRIKTLRNTRPSGSRPP
jgi:hypothetical protein